MLRRQIDRPKTVPFQHAFPPPSHTSVLLFLHEFRELKLKLTSTHHHHLLLFKMSSPRPLLTAVQGTEEGAVNYKANGMKSRRLGRSGLKVPVFGLGGELAFSFFHLSLYLELQAYLHILFTNRMVDLYVQLRRTKSKRGMRRLSFSELELTSISSLPPFSSSSFVRRRRLGLRRSCQRDPENSLCWRDQLLGSG